MKQEKIRIKKQQVKKKQEDNDGLKDFPIDIKRDILDIINDTPSLVRLGTKEYRVQNMRYYSLYRICKLVTDMYKGDKELNTDERIITALCTDLDAMCEIVAIILVNHLFTPDGEKVSWEQTRSRNDRYISIMKAKVMNSTFDSNQWATIILGAVKSIDLSGFFLLKKSVNMLTDSIMMRKKKSIETASQFMEAQSLQMQVTSSEPSHNTD